MVGVFGLREIVAWLALATVHRWLGSRQPFNSDLRSSSCPGVGLGGVLWWRLLTRLVWVRCFRGGLGVEFIASLLGVDPVVATRQQEINGICSSWKEINDEHKNLKCIK
ncbi:30S ribosomal protein S8 [Striga asiatica]|uniref:30S ribosomal protein S8 n=1 Tax=Striga asiatica TaxID=4170 RepID=A0A5A7R2X5_STRAF|nr:30S ribosomal protein S8 [Striga asiatica]